MFRRFAALSFCLCVLGACDKGKGSDTDKKPAPQAEPTAKTADGVRTIPVSATADGYSPDKITGKPGEKLKLVFTRTVDSSCLAQLKTPDGAMVDLPMNKAVEVAVTVPQTGQVGFACGMDMFHGVIVAEPKT
jgi:plastocyanin domain-containing protein